MNNPFYNPKCKYGQGAKQFCSSSICNQYPGVCKIKGCSCIDSHKKCMNFVTTKQFLSKIANRSSEMELYSDMIDQLLTGMIKKLNQMSVKFKKYKNKKWKGQAQLQIVSMIKSQDFQKLTPSLIKRLMEQESSLHQFDLDGLFSKIAKKTNQQFQVLLCNIEELLIDSPVGQKQKQVLRKTCLQTLKFQSGKPINYLELRSTQSNVVFNKMDPHMMRYDQICYLQLRSQGIGINDIQSLGTALVNLTTLDLCECEIDDRTAVQLTNYFPKLKVLWLRKNNIGDQGALAISNRYSGLTYLNIAKNLLSQKVKQAIGFKLSKAKVYL